MTAMWMSQNLREPTCWEVLGLKGPSDRDEVNAAFRKRRDETHGPSVSPLTYGYIENAYLDCLRILGDTP